MADNTINRQSAPDVPRQSLQEQAAREGDAGDSGHGSDSGNKPDLEKRIREDMKVVDAEGAHVGTVDRCEGGQIKLTKADSRDGEHRFISLDQVENVEGGTVTIRGSIDEPFGQNGS